jgi:hypothetical protein
MITLVKFVEAGMYVLGAFGVGIALGGIGLVLRAFVRKQDQLLRRRLDEADQRRHAGTGFGAAG